MSEKLCLQSVESALRTPGAGGGVPLGSLGGGVPPGSSNPHPILDQKM